MLAEYGCSSRLACRDEMTYKIETRSRREGEQA
jgi:hypothetical protein